MRRDLADLPPAVVGIDGHQLRGGRHRRHADRQLVPARPSLQLDQQEIYLDATLDKIANLFH